MSAIGPGTLLLCVDDGGGDWVRLYIKAGAVYECSELVETVRGCARDGCKGPLIRLAGMSLAGNGSLCSHRFVPAGRRGEFESLLKVADAPADLQGEDA